MPTPRTRLLLLAAALLATATLPAAAQPDLPEDRRIDPETGRDNRVWPPDVVFDYRHLRIEVDIPDMDQPRFSGRTTMIMAPIAYPQGQVRLDAGPGLTFGTIAADGAAAAFTHAGSRLVIDLPRMYGRGETLALVLEYEAENPGGKGAGLTFSKDDPRTPEHDPMCHAQGQPQTNHLWFPCHDFPNYRVPTEVIATVPTGFTAVSNGRLVEVRRRGGGAVAGGTGGANGAAGTSGEGLAGGAGGGRSTFHWRQDLPHAVYLVTLVVGKFDVVDVGGPESARPGLWMPVYGPLGSAEALKRNFGNTPDMIAYFEELFDEPFPWDKYANIICRDFAAGAMENTSAVTWASFGAAGPRSAIESTNAHELVHQWFGNLVTCKSWEHLWLNEGWASFGEAMWVEHTRGEGAYRRAVARFAGQTRGGARGSRPQSTGMASNLYTDPDERFFSPDNVYAKGAWVLHALRSRLGDEPFWAGTRLYLKRHKFGQVETDDFRRALEDASGQSLERFFEQFVVRPGIPRIDVHYSWDEQEGVLTVRLEQTQRIDADNPAYAIDIPLRADYADGESEFFYIDTDRTTSESRIQLPRKPEQVVVDPTMTIPAAFRVRTDLAGRLLDGDGQGVEAADAADVEEAAGSAVAGGGER